MEHSTVTEFDVFFSMQKGKFSYPFLCIDNPSDELVVLLQGIPEGDLPVTVKYHNQIVEVYKMKRSPRMINRLLTLYTILLITGEGIEPIKIETIQDMLEVGDFDWTQ